MSSHGEEDGAQWMAAGNQTSSLDPESNIYPYKFQHGQVENFLSILTFSSINEKNNIYWEMLFNKIK